MVDLSLYYSAGLGYNVLSFVKSTDGRYFLTTGTDSSGNPDTPVSTTNLAMPFFYELKFNNDYTTASLIPIYQPLTVADPSTACVEGQVSLLSLKDNKLAVLFGVDQVYIYDINTGTFLEINSQQKHSSNTNLNTTGSRTVNQNKMAYDHINNKLYVVTGSVWGAAEINYIIYDMVKGVKQNLVLSKAEALTSGSLHYFTNIFFKDGSLFGYCFHHTATSGKPRAATVLSYKNTSSANTYRNGGNSQHYVKSFGITQITLHITTFGHRYDEIIHSVNNLREMTTIQRHMSHVKLDAYFPNVTNVLDRYMFRIF